MDPEPSGVFAAADRLSRLGDATLGHILSFLPAAEAARASALSRRWRHVFPGVHTISFTEKPPKRRRKPPQPLRRRQRLESGRGRHSAAAAVALPFTDAISTALHARHGGPHIAAPAPLRGLRIEFSGSKVAASAAAIDGWLHYAARNAAAAELHIDLRIGRGPICAHRYGLHHRRSRQRYYSYEPSPDCGSPPSPYYYAPPGSLLRCAALRSLRLASCHLDTPLAGAAMPSLETLHLTRVAGGGGAVQRLVSACPHLADLTLEACGDLTELSVLSPRLHKLTLRCCHSLAVVSTAADDSSELRRFEYSGPMPGPTFQTRSRRISSCTINFCGEEATDDPTELARLGEFLMPFAGATTSLQIKSARLGAGVGNGVLSSALEFPGFHALRHLELIGMLPEDDAVTVAGLARMLELTPILETLSVFFMPDPEILMPDPEISSDYNYRIDDDGLSGPHKLRYDRYAALAVPEGAGVACLRETTREINLVYYQGSTAQRVLAKFLLCNARIVGEVYCEFARGPLFIQTKLMEEIAGWVLNKSANMIFC